MNKKIKIGNKNYEIKVAQYADNGRLYLGLYNKYGWYNDITINLSDAPELTNRQIFLSNNLTKEERKALFNDGVITETMAYVPYNMSSYDVAFVDFNKLLEYDKSATEGFLKNRGIKLEQEDDNTLNQDTEMER